MIENPALKAFVGWFGDEVLLAQVLVRRSQTGYELRHLEDRKATPQSLRPVRSVETRTLVQFTAGGEFRPLRAAPTLPKGWRIQAANDTELEHALNGLYPGALADWYAIQSPNASLTDYRTYAGRQSGMYRITAKLTDAQAAAVILAGCDSTKCLKRRLWSVVGLEPDLASRKSVIPCLQPCAVLLELARTEARAGQEAACAGPDTD